MGCLRAEAYSDTPCLITPSKQHPQPSPSAAAASKWVYVPSGLVGTALMMWTHTLSAPTQTLVLALPMSGTSSPPSYTPSHLMWLSLFKSDAQLFRFNHFLCIKCI